MASKTKDIALDKLLVARSKDGDHTAFDALVGRYWDRIYARVLYLLKNREDAEEVTQDAFLRARRGLEKFRGDSSFSTWLFQIATNLAHNKYWYWVRRKRHESIALEQSALDGGDTTLIDMIPAEGEDPRYLSINKEFVDRVSECIGNLNEKHREILTLRTVQDLSYEEISQKLHISVGTVKSRIARARENLREKMGVDFI
ncbi:MAG: RNA polymerase subunit sigma-24 [Rhodospirillaceae bacterium]|uniref:ECF RNA polymerase sigma-E factor n=1 Tax=Candidatus Moanibacter tarae TaxID=2200854 RepID=A0A2Z4ALA9_9BACT|nr:MAG: ECF RNA polymerase sigma-E factor [Candidatus Moanabacter tarae]MBH66954.1 RNA polymerase subunit sigma-24 [Rhodospirillaceae bacterium]|tara:strand:- start:19647 stop:20249 length:603 start_codon:yes stop_codon:yes gene_type:complete